jgi:exopolysaccharide/PEP-CTERM locus tyrosine autokinase
MDHKKVEEDRSPGSVPDVSFDDKWLHKNLVSLLGPESYEAEQFKMLRNTILFPVAGVTPRSILITSALPGDGKSFVSANLAVSIAMNINKHVLLVDCDLRKPDLHRVFGFGDVPGLSDYLAEHRSLDSLLLKTTVEKLTLLPGGPIPSNPSELASSERMSAMLEEVKHRYQDRLIVIDSPPPGMAAETSFLARQVDGILLVVKYGNTPREEVEDLKVTLGSEKILGVVINFLDMPVSKRYGYGKYEKYGGYGSGKK